MPIKINHALPAKAVLQSENIFVMESSIAEQQDIRPLRILILNLMPTKITTETQLLRCLSNTPLQIETTLLQTKTYISKNTPSEHLSSFYQTFDDIKKEKFDGMIITGAPVENLPFEEVEYWQELCEIMDWSHTNVFSTLHICWGAQAALYYHYGIEKYPLEEKMFGIFEHTVNNPHLPLFRGFDQTFYVPQSRHTEVRAKDIIKQGNLKILSESGESGLYIVGSTNGRQLFLTGHPEYDQETLAAEYFRDIEKGMDIKVPKNYFQNDDPSLPPIVRWRAHASLLYTNWLNYYVYQSTPYDINDIF